MRVTDILDRYPQWVADIRDLEYNLKHLRDYIIYSTGSGSGERVQSSNISDSTADKALRLIKATEENEERKAILEERISLVKEAMARMEVDEKKVIELYHFSRYSTQEISTLTGIPVWTIRRLLVSGRAHLDHLEEIIE